MLRYAIKSPSPTANLPFHPRGHQRSLKRDILLIWLTLLKHTLMRAVPFAQLSAAMQNMTKGSERPISKHVGAHLALAASRACWPLPEYHTLCTLSMATTVTTSSLQPSCSEASSALARRGSSGRSAMRWPSGAVSLAISEGRQPQQPQGKKLMGEKVGHYCRDKPLHVS